ncbi:glycosyltransferase family 4 protein [Negadavirga shengliensis]|uniref:Glycosyltransferase family 4 protein n=1 Tax=Negadavirga shengliensis TaxID=1389218 RepID=A0ABV9T3H5_9BACT
MVIGIEAQRIFRKKRHGMDMVAIEMIRHLQKIDKENLYFIFVNEQEDPSCISQTENFKIITLPKSPYPIWEQYHLARAAKSYRLDILHCTSNTAPVSCPAKLILTLHDIIYLERLNLNEGTWYQRMGNLYRRWNVPKIVGKARKIITVSNYEKNRIRAHFRLENGRVETVYNGVSPHFKPASEEEQAKAREKYALPNEFILFLGNTDPKKNLKGVLAALKPAYQSGLPLPDIVMPDFGEQALDHLLADLDALSIRGKIRLTGYIPNQDLPAIYSSAKFFLYPSLRESFGLPILEAMACGCPVITSNTASMPEIAGDAALLVDPFDPESISKAMVELMENAGLREKLRQAGFGRPPLFDYLQGAKRILGLYKEIHKN